MLYEIKNDKLSISADTFGAELHSIKLRRQRQMCIRDSYQTGQQRISLAMR